ncbi:MAG: hypothetical protein M3548_10940 [Actinomycetota bacterium]|nr:hypothetical protein [Actinomycetota bacterium]
MSEYQYYEFLALDRPLNDRQRGELRSLSTRADITPTSFVNEYHWGNFRGEPSDMMQRYFDAHLYLTNWGTHHLMFRLPKRLLDYYTAERYCLGDSANAWLHGDHVILDLTSEDESGDWDGTDETRLGSIVGIRAEIAAGDLRPLYLAWLLCAQVELDDDELEPPVPPNLGSLTAAQRGLADFLRIDDDLIDAAADTSEDSAIDELRDSDLVEWIGELSPLERDSALFAFLQDDDPHLRAELLRRIRDTATDLPAASAPRTVGELLATASERREARERLIEQGRAKERLRREQQAALARDKRLDTLAAREDAAWLEVGDMIGTTKPKEYDRAIVLLADLRALADRSGQAEVFDQRYQRLRVEHQRKPSFIERLDRARLG